MDLLPFEKIDRELLIKKESDTDMSIGKKPEERSIPELLERGVINLNKPKGPTSHMVSYYVKNIFGSKKVGHGGSLDPAVTGVLPVALNRATGVLGSFLGAGKEYVCVMHIHKLVPEDEIRKACRDFIGEITQLPPKLSSVKRVKRKRTIYYFDILEIDGQDVLFKMGSQAGTYVRRICDDVGKKLGVGAHMSELVRTKSGPLNIDFSVSLQDLEDAFYFYKKEGNEKFLRHCVKPVEFAVSHLPKIYVLDSSVDTLCRGAPLHIPGISMLDSGINKDDKIAVMTLKEELVCLAVAEISSDQIMKQERGLAAISERVLMDCGVYLSR
jgi:H/ACA ribonucleoprotein complex subunit 4